MNMEERNIGIYLTNLSEYTKGNMLGEWVRLPCSKKHMEDVFKHLQLDNGESEYFITDYDAPTKDMYQSLGEFEKIDELNFLAARLADMSVSDYEKYTAIVEAGISTYSSAEEYLNLTYNLNKFNFISVKDEHELGEYLCQDIILELPTVQGVDLSMYIDYERIGSDYAINVGGLFCKNGFVEQREYTEELYLIVPDLYKIVPDMDKMAQKVDISGMVQYMGNLGRNDLVEWHGDYHMFEKKSGITDEKIASEYYEARELALRNHVDEMER